MSSTASASSEGGRAYGLGPRRAVVALAGGAIVAAALAVAALAGLLGGSSASAGARSTAATHGASATRSTGTTASSAKYGGLPSWLPKPKVQINRVLTASAGRPALAIQGESVNVDLAHAHVLATVVGPEVPEEGKFPVPKTSPCTFIVTFAGASGAIPLNPAAFTFVDELGRIHRPRVTAMDGGPPPRALEPGRPVSLKVFDVLPTGDGGLRWTPNGTRPTVAWDYTVEID